MKIALIGYGKMGKEIEQILISRGHTVTLIIDIDNAGDLNAENLRNGRAGNIGIHNRALISTPLHRCGQKRCN